MFEIPPARVPALVPTLTTRQLTTARDLILAGERWSTTPVPSDKNGPTLIGEAVAGLNRYARRMRAWYLELIEAELGRRGPR